MRKRWARRALRVVWAGVRRSWGTVRTAVDRRDVLAWAGTAAVARGAWMWEPVAGWIALGVALLYMGLWHPLLYLWIRRREAD